MEPVYIVMICAGVVFLALLIAYGVNYVKQKKIQDEKSRILQDAYSDEKITKMEYDLAFYDEETRRLLSATNVEQVTIDELLGGDKQLSDAATKKTDDAIFNKIENDGVEEIMGNFKG